MSKFFHRRFRVHNVDLYVPEASWAYLPVDVVGFEGLKNGQLSGSIEVVQKVPSETLDVGFFALDGKQLLEWLYLRSVTSKSTNPVNYFLFEESVKSKVWSFKPTHGGRYYLILDNRRCALNPKELHLEAFIEWDEVQQK